MPSTSLPNSPFGRFGSQWTVLALDNDANREDALAPRLVASSPPSPMLALRGRARQPAAFRALLYDRVNLVVEAPDGPEGPDDYRDDPEETADLEAAERLLMLLSLPPGAAAVSYTHLTLPTKA